MTRKHDDPEYLPPRPWSVYIVDGMCWGILAADGTEIVQTDCGYYPPNLKTAEFICECVNAVSEVPG